MGKASKRAEPRLASPTEISSFVSGKKKSARAAGLFQLTVYVDREVHLAAKVFAAKNQTTLSALAEEGFRLVMSSKR